MNRKDWNPQVEALYEELSLTPSLEGAANRVKARIALVTDGYFMGDDIKILVAALYRRAFDFYAYPTIPMRVSAVGYLDFGGM